MPRRKKRVYKKSKGDDRLLMLLAACAAIIVGFFAIFSYKSQSVALIPSSNPSQIMTVNLNAQNGSGESGTATLQEVSGKLVVTLSLTGFPKGITQPAHIHIGSCPNPGAIKFPLTSVLDGKSVTTLDDVKLSDLKSMGALAVNVHKSVSSSNVYYSCGDLK